MLTAFAYPGASLPTVANPRPSNNTLEQSSNMGTASDAMDISSASLSPRRRSRARPILYTSSVVGSYGFDIATEWYFLTCHCLHLGFIQSCTRFSVKKISLCPESLNVMILICTCDSVSEPGAEL